MRYRRHYIHVDFLSDLADIRNAIVLIYDPLVTSQGSLSLRAYRLSEKFMKLCRERNFTPQKCAILDFLFIVPDQIV